MPHHTPSTMPSYTTDVLKFENCTSHVHALPWTLWLARVLNINKAFTDFNAFLQDMEGTINIEVIFLLLFASLLLLWKVLKTSDYPLPLLQSPLSFFNFILKQWFGLIFFFFNPFMSAIVKGVLNSEFMCWLDRWNLIWWVIIFYRIHSWCPCLKPGPLSLSIIW